MDFEREIVGNFETNLWDKLRARRGAVGKI